MQPGNRARYWPLVGHRPLRKLAKTSSNSNNLQRKFRRLFSRVAWAFKYIVSESKEISESTQLDDCSNEALLCQIDWRSECLQERLKLAQTISERISISEMLIIGLIEAYEVCSIYHFLAEKRRKDEGKEEQGRSNRKYNVDFTMSI